MKAIPKELRAYFPKSDDPSRPWWSYLLDAGAYIRHDGHVRARPPEFVTIDSTHPLPPPPILVGQVWAIPTTAPGSFFIASLIAVELRSDGRRGLHWAGFAPSHPVLDTYTHGILLTCPFGYAPWSGPEVP